MAKHNKNKPIKNNQTLQKNTEKGSGQVAVPAQSFTAVRQFTGPIPPPETLAQYEQILPGAMNRIITMAEKQQDHQHQMESTLVNIEGKAISALSTRSFLGLGAAFMVALSAIVGSIYLLATGKSIAGFATMIGSLAALVAIFVYGKKKDADMARNNPETDPEQQQLELPLS